jgi:cohesin domain-containing protein
MTPHRTPTRSAASVALTTAFVALAAAAIGCGGGSTTTTSSGPRAAFTPDTPAPTAGTIALLAGSTSGANVNVRVTVTGVPSFFGAAFRLSYDTTALLFNGMTDTTSLLRGAPATDDGHLSFIEDHASIPGEIIITATRLDPTVAAPVDVTTTADLVVLNFTARKVIAVATAEGRLDFGDPKQACDGSAPPCGSIAVTWSGGAVSAQQ